MERSKVLPQPVIKTLELSASSPVFIFDWNAELYFDQTQRSKKGVLIPLEVESNKPHACDISSPFPCMHCGQTIYLDKKVLSPTGKRIPLDFNTDEYHACKKKQRPQSELRYFRKRGVFAD